MGNVGSPFELALGDVGVLEIVVSGVVAYNLDEFGEQFLRLVEADGTQSTGG